MRIIATRARGRERNARGDWVGDPSSLEFPAIYAPAESTEDHDRRDTATTTAVLYTDGTLPDVVRTDRVTTPEPVAGTWEVTGDPQKWVSPFTGDVGGMVIRLRKVE